MLLSDFIELNCDEDELFIVQDYEDEVIHKLWHSDYRINKEKYISIVSKEVENWAADSEHIVVWIK